LNTRFHAIVDKRANPEWVTTAVNHRQLFGEAPCAPYVEPMLRGDAQAIDQLCYQLGIDKASWFHRELLLAQVNGATKLPDVKFLPLLDRLLELLGRNEILRDIGFSLLLDRYSRIPGTPLDAELRNSAVDWWGNPWLPSNTRHWGAVTEEARIMVADWLKLEFIEAFFTKLAEDGMGQPRRMIFWKRYVRSISNIRFALGSAAMYSDEPDMVILRTKMNGLLSELSGTGGHNNAFIMTMGNLVAVEFSGTGNALYGYDASHPLPFDVKQTLHLPVNGRNSLKHKGDEQILWLSHQDGIKGFDRWEDYFSKTIDERFSIKPDSAIRSATIRYRRGPSASPAQSSDPLKDASGPPPFENHRIDALTETLLRSPYTMENLGRLSASRGIRIVDLEKKGSCLWVMVNNEDRNVSKILTAWGFHFKSGKGWWK
jgi:hypothetical protein